MYDQPGTQRDWSNLPNVILFLVLQCLKNTETDCRRLRAVCISWRSSLSLPNPPPLPFPLNIKRPVPGYGHNIYELGVLTQNVFYLISLPKESSNANDVWVTHVAETLHPSSPPNMWKLRNPVWGVDANPDQLPELKAKVNLLDWRISEVARSYRLGSGYHVGTLKTVMLFFSTEDIDDENFSLFILTLTQRLLLFNSRTDKWVDIFLVCHPIGDILAYEGKFYAANTGGQLIAIDPITFEVSEIIKPYLEDTE